ncbi:uncharacterized protein [Mytilus edulis]|uniref:uncharacterized protein n=1 Tax=Mytilus edulis TaxID=6550 RepID=UPI0039F05D24
MAKTVANAELKQLKKEYLDCKKEKEQIESYFSFYRKGNLPKNIAETNATLLDAWRIEDNNFYETNGSKLVYAKVKDFSCILVTSNSGLGKTAIIRHIALKLHSEGFEIVPVESPEDIIKYKTKQNQVFLIDDVLGKYGLSLTLLEKWERINEKLTSCLGSELGANKLLCTLRLQIALNTRFTNASTILNQVIVNLEEGSSELSKEEKRKILLKHLNRSNKENEMKPEEIEIVCQTKYAFPLLCKLVSTNEERFRNRITFFRQPISLLNEELNKMSIENKSLYCSLVLCMLYNGTLSRSIFDFDSRECDEKIYKIMQHCGLQRNTSKKELGDSVLCAIGSYFTQESDNIRFIHDALEETVGRHFCLFNPKVMFSECDLLFIRDRVRVRSDINGNEQDEYIVIIQEDELDKDHLRPLYDRLFKELKSGRFSSLLMSHLFKNRNFIRIFGTIIDNNGRMLVHTLLIKVCSERLQRDQSIFEKAIEFLSSNRDQSAVGRKVKDIFLSNKEFQDNSDAISRVVEAKWSRSTLMYWIVAFGCYEFFHYVWNKITTIERKWLLTRDILYQPSVKSFFPLAVLGGSIAIVTELISSGADVNCFSEIWETSLYIAVSTSQYDMAHLLMRNGAKVNLRAWCAMKTPILVTGSKVKLTSLLLQYDLNQTELHIAVRQNDLKKLRSNITSENINSRTKSGWTVLHYAVILNNLEAVRTLFQEVFSQNGDSNLDSVQDAQGDMMYRRPKPKVSIVDSNGLTAVHLAVAHNYTKILSLLLRNGGKVRVHDDFDRTPLHYTKSDCAIKYLLSHSCQNNYFGNCRSAEEGNGYTRNARSAFRTVWSNISQHTALGGVCRNFVNMPDKEGNTPLHSVIKRSLSEKVKRDCIKTLLHNGADPYLCNESGLSVFEIIDCSSEATKYINYSETYRKLIEKTHAVFALAMLTLIALTIAIPLYVSIFISQESQNSVYCIGQVAESGAIILEPTKLSKYVIWLSIVLFLSLSITFKTNFSVSFKRIFRIFVLIGCGVLIYQGEIFYIHFIYKFMYFAIYIVIRLILLIHVASYVFTLSYMHIPSWAGITGIGILLFMIIIVFDLLVYVTYTAIVIPSESLSYSQSSTIPEMNILKITSSNCIEFSLENITCMSQAYNNTYQNGVDFSVQCHTDPNITSYKGTLAAELGYTDWQEIGFVFGTSSKQSEIRRDTFVAALGIGTSFSGYAISLLTDYNKDPLNIQTFNWISRFDGHVTNKMPSDLLLRPDGTFHSFGYDAEYNYENAKPSDRGTQVMGLLQFIQDDAKSNRFIVIKDVTGKEIFALDVFCYCIYFLKNDIMTKLQQQIDIVQESDIHFVLNVPAIWSDKAKQFMGEVAERVRFKVVLSSSDIIQECVSRDRRIEGSKLSLALEPEAAAIFCQHVPTTRQTYIGFPPSLASAKDTIKVFGGTVDITGFHSTPDGVLRELMSARGGEATGVLMPSTIHSLNT